MQIKKKPTAWGLFGLWAVWTFIGQPIWNLNVERVAERSKIDGTLADAAAMTALRDLADYLPSSFAAGFVVGALIFAYWDNLISYWKRWRGKGPKPDKRAWIGNMWPEFDPQRRNVELWISLICIGDIPLKLKRVEGSASITAANRRYPLSNPRLDAVPEGSFERGTYATFSVRFDAPPKIWEVMPHLFEWRNPRTYLQFEDFAIVMETPDGDEKHVPGWNSIRLTVGEWEVRSVQTFPLFESEEKRAEFQRAMGSLAEQLKGERP